MTSLTENRQQLSVEQKLALKCHSPAFYALLFSDPLPNTCTECAFFGNNACNLLGQPVTQPICSEDDWRTQAIVESMPGILAVERIDKEAKRIIKNGVPTCDELEKLPPILQSAIQRIASKK